MLASIDFIEISSAYDMELFYCFFFQNCYWFIDRRNFYILSNCFPVHYDGHCKLLILDDDRKCSDKNTQIKHYSRFYIENKYHQFKLNLLTEN